MSGWLNRDTNVLHAHRVLTGGGHHQRGIWSACGQLKVSITEGPLKGGLRRNVEYVDGFPDGAHRCAACVSRLTFHRDNVDRWLRGDG